MLNIRNILVNAKWKNLEEHLSDIRKISMTQFLRLIKSENNTVMNYYKIILKLKTI